MPDTNGYPRTKEGRNNYVSKCIKVVKKENPKKSLNAIIGQCEGMWKNKWNSKSSKSSEYFFADINDEELEQEIKHDLGQFELDIPANKF